MTDVDTGVVDQDVEASDLLFDLTDEASPLVGLSDVQVGESGPPTCFPDLRGDPFTLLVEDVTQVAARTLSCEEPGLRLSLPPRTTGDDGHLALQPARAAPRGTRLVHPQQHRLHLFDLAHVEPGHVSGE